MKINEHCMLKLAFTELYSIQLHSKLGADTTNRRQGDKGKSNKAKYFYEQFYLIIN